MRGWVAQINVRIMWRRSRRTNEVTQVSSILMLLLLLGDPRNTPAHTGHNKQSQKRQNNVIAQHLERGKCVAILNRSYWVAPNSAQGAPAKLTQYCYINIFNCLHFIARLAVYSHWVSDVTSSLVAVTISQTRQIEHNSSEKTFVFCENESGVFLRRFQYLCKHPTNRQIQQLRGEKRRQCARDWHVIIFIWQLLLISREKKVVNKK